ncbi:MAG TPA: hypothetical protein VG709_04295 [Actinomycetota bacterium]|nr:hypothetical protein [Actinomycetota bacterium]
MNAADARSHAGRRAAAVIPSLYGVVGAAVGLWLFIAAMLEVLVATARLALDLWFESTWADPLRSVTAAFPSAVVAAVVVWWHVRYGIRGGREGAREGSWRASLYFHLVALVALVAALIGAVEVKSAAADLVAPQCIAPATTDYVPGRSCFPPSSVAVRNAIEGAALFLVASPIFLWHIARAPRRSSRG